VRLEDINNNIEEIDDIDVKNLSKEIIWLIFQDNYWNYNFIKT
jgi:lysozyme family protein